MKKLILSLSIFAVTAISYGQQLKTIVIPATAVVPSEGKTLVISRNYSRFFMVDAELKRGKEYYLKIELDEIQQAKTHCSGCTGVLPVKLLQYEITPRQAKRDSALIFLTGKKR